MKVLLDIKDEKAPFVLELLQNFPFVKAKKLSSEKNQLIAEIEEAVKNVKLAKQGKLKAQSARELYHEL
jgi:hypothetical protein